MTTYEILLLLDPEQADARQEGIVSRTRELGLEEAGADLLLDSLADLPPDELLARFPEG